MTATTDSVRNGAGPATGTTTNDNAGAGQLGEFITATVPVGSAVSLTTATTANMTSITLTPGDWDINCQVNFNITGGTVTDVRMGPSPTSATIATQPAQGVVGTDALVVSPLGLAGATGVYTLGNIDVRVSTASTVTIFATTLANFSVGTVSVYGTIRARRVR